MAQQDAKGSTLSAFSVQYKEDRGHSTVNVNILKQTYNLLNG